MARLRIHVRPGSSRDQLGWDPWRSCWVVSCQEAAVGGRANRAVARLMAEWLGVGVDSVDWERAGASREKLLRIDGLVDEEIDRRLRAHLSS